MSRPLDERLGDILAAVDRCVKYVHFLNSADAAIRDMAYDAILRNIAVHEYCRVDPTKVVKIVEQDLGPLAERMRECFHKTDVSDPDR